MTLLAAALIVLGAVAGLFVVAGVVFVWRFVHRG
jgi:hypothetical protein